MDLQANAVPQPVAEMFAVARVDDQLARRAVHVTQTGPGVQRLAAGPLRIGDQRIDLELPVGGLAQHESAGHVGVIAGHQRAEVDLDEIALRQHRIGRPVVRDRRIRPCRNNGLERDRIGPVVEHQGLQLARHRTFGATGPQPAALDQIGQRGVGRLAGQPQQRQLTGVFDLAQGLDSAGGPHQLGAYHSACL